MKKIAVIALSLATALASSLPAEAFPIVSSPKPAASSSVDLVQYRRGPPRAGWYNGHRGYRGYRPGYRRYNDGWWYPLAAFGAGAIIGGAIANQPRNVAPEGGINPRHVEWCSARYRTYNAYDNTYAPRVGVRAQCLSPYY